MSLSLLALSVRFCSSGFSEQRSQLMKVTEKDVAYVADLANLELSPTNAPACCAI